MLMWNINHENLRTAKSMLGKVLFVNPLNCTQVADLPSWAGCSCKSMQFSFSLVFACVCMFEVVGDGCVCVCVCMCICVCIFPVSQCFGFHNWKLAKSKQKANSCIWSESMLNSVRLSWAKNTFCWCTNNFTALGKHTSVLWADVADIYSFLLCNAYRHLSHVLGQYRDGIRWLFHGALKHRESIIRSRCCVGFSYPLTTGTFSLVPY